MSAAPTTKRRRFSTAAPEGRVEAYEKYFARARRMSSTPPHLEASFSLVRLAVLRGLSASGAERDPTAGGADERDQLVDIGGAELLLDAREREPQVGPDAGEKAGSGGERAHAVPGQAPATEPPAAEAAT